MAIEDHLNLTGLDPGVGLGTRRWATLRPDATWDAALIASMTSAASERGMALARGVYAARLGPSYETLPRSDDPFLRRRRVGMSTVLEPSRAR